MNDIVNGEYGQAYVQKMLLLKNRMKINHIDLAHSLEFRLLVDGLGDFVHIEGAEGE